mgnify:CR=1 FL=1
MYNSIKLNLYTQDDCPYCFVMKQKLTDWGYDFNEINISYDLDKKKFLKEGYFKYLKSIEIFLNKKENFINK